jgi:hypothetical protein
MLHKKKQLALKLALGTGLHNTLPFTYVTAVFMKAHSAYTLHELTRENNKVNLNADL